MTERLFLDKLRNWAELQTDIYAILLVGSHARGDAKPDSDVDLVIICNEPSDYLKQVEWIREFGKPSRKVFEDWGIVTSVRVWYEDGLEVEFGITTEDWVKEPLDEGTKRTINDGYQILVDKSAKATRVLARSTRP